MSDHARQAGTAGGLSLTFGSAAWEWVHNSGLFTAPTLLAVLGVLLTLLINLDKIVANVRLIGRRFRPEPVVPPVNANHAYRESQ